jgi:large subunit ribosomal protein L21
MSEDYAIVESGGKQYRAEEGASLLVDRLPGEAGEKINLRAVMFRGGKDVVVEPSELDKVKVEAVVAEQLRGPKVRVFKYRPKKGYRRRAGHRSELTKLEVRSVKMLSRRPAAKKESAVRSPQSAEQTADSRQQTAEKKPAAKKPAVKKPAVKKAAAKKPAAKKAPAAKKPAARKPAARKPAAKKEGS